MTQRNLMSLKSSSEGVKDMEEFKEFRKTPEEFCYNFAVSLWDGI